MPSHSSVDDATETEAELIIFAELLSKQYLDLNPALLLGSGAGSEHN